MDTQVYSLYMMYDKCMVELKGVCPAGTTARFI
jgi:hypothetical protein